MEVATHVSLALEPFTTKDYCFWKGKVKLMESLPRVTFYFSSAITSFCLFLFKLIGYGLGYQLCETCEFEQCVIETCVANTAMKRTEPVGKPWNPSLDRALGKKFCLLEWPAFSFQVALIFSSHSEVGLDGPLKISCSWRNDALVQGLWLVLQRISLRCCHSPERFVEYLGGNISSKGKVFNNFFFDTDFFFPSSCRLVSGV